MIKKKIYIIILFFFLINSITSALDEVENMRCNFITLGIDEKLQILKSAEQSPNDIFIPLYEDAIEYVKNSYPLLKDDIRLLKIGAIAVRKIGEFKYTNAKANIRYLFSIVENEEFQIECLKTISYISEKDSSFINYLNSIYETGLLKIIEGKPFNINLLIVYAETLGSFADQASFEVLLKTLFYPVNKKLKTTVSNALANIPFNYFNEISLKKELQNIEYIQVLYMLAKKNKFIDEQELGRISELVIDYGINNLYDFDTQVLSNLIIETLPVLSKLKWSKASNNVNKFFYFAQSERKKKDGLNFSITSIIECMGNLGTTECSQNLSIFLGILNSETEKTLEYDEKLILSVINALSKLGDKIAFDYLLYIEYLNYNDTIKQAARNAIKELKW